jgi:hypothetical protein
MIDPSCKKCYGSVFGSGAPCNDTHVSLSAMARQNDWLEQVRSEIEWIENVQL